MRLYLFLKRREVPGIRTTYDKKSLRQRLITLFVLTIMLPIMAMSLIISWYSEQMLANETARLTDTIIHTIGQNIQLYQEDLDRLTTIPYYHENILYAIKLKSSGLYEQAHDYNRLVADRALNSTLVNYIQNARNDILGFTIVMKNSEVFQSAYEGSNHTYRDPAMLTESWYTDAVAARGQAVFLGKRASDHHLYPEGTEVFSVARIIVDPDNRNLLGVIITDADTRVLDQLIGQIDFPVSSITLITDAHGQMVYTNSTQQIPISEELVSEPVVTIGSETYRPVSAVIEHSGWKITVLLSEAEQAKKVTWIYLVGISFMLIGCLITIVVYRSMSVHFVTPVNRIIEVIKQVEQGDLSVSVPDDLSASSEFATMNHQLNEMIISLRDHIEREYIAVLDQKTAQYQALQSQIKPHFLYNTLTGFLTLNRIGESQQLEKSIRDLTGMLRYIQQSETTTTLREELQFVDRYCRLQRLRFPNRLDYRIIQDSRADHLQIPRLLLQPLVENAIIHGIEPTSRSCSMVLRTEVHDQLLTITLHDDGVGFDPDTVRLESSIGIGNCRERLMIAFSEARFTIESSAAEGTLLQITIPFDPSGEAQE